MFGLKEGGEVIVFVEGRRILSSLKNVDDPWKLEKLYCSIKVKLETSPRRWQENWIGKAMEKDIS